MYHNFIGIDIAKDTFVVAQHDTKETRVVDNSLKGFKAFYKDYQAVLLRSLVILETTGGYEMALLRYLQANHIRVHRANTTLVKHFICSTGRHGKSDKIDALGLADYGAERYQRLALYQAPTQQQQQLQKLIVRRQELKKYLVAEKNRLDAPEQQSIKRSISRMLTFLQKELTLLEQAIEKLIAQDETLLRSREVLIKEVAGIGAVTANALLILLPELGHITRREIASLAGLAPHPYESGKKIGYRRTAGGRDDIKSILFMAAMTASRSKAFLGDFYRSLIARGKKKMVALTALMRKILVIANAKVRDLNLAST